MSGLHTRIRGEIARGREPAPGAITTLTEPDAPRLGAVGLAEIRERLGAELLGLGPLEPLLADVRVTDILVNGGGEVWVDRGEGVVRAACRVEGESGTRRLAVRLAGLAGRRLDDAQPWVDGLLPGGIRLHAILPPLVEAGAHVSLRVPRRMRSGLDELASVGMVDPTVRQVLRGLVRRRVSYVVTGGTGSGKTTLLGALLAEVPGHERIVLVEDVRELSVDHPHLIRLQGRPPNLEGQGEVRLEHVVRQALRMRPDRLAVGEVRGAEVREMLAALNTGHEGGCGTVHANRPEDLPARFEALGALAGLSREAVQVQLASAVRVVVHVGRGPDGRRVQSVSVLSEQDRRVVVRPVLTATGWADGAESDWLREVVAS